MRLELEDNELSALLIFPLALIGTVCNWTICTKSQSLSTFRNSFGRLTAAQSFGDALHSTLFLTLFVPMAWFDIECLKTNSHHLGHALLVAYDISTYLHLCISINRFFSLILPMAYEKVFSTHLTITLISMSYSLAIFPSFYLYVYNNCKFYIDDYYWSFVFLSNTVCQRISWYADYIKYNVVILSCVVLDSITITKVHLTSKKLFTTNSSTSHRFRRRREVSFLTQACLQAFVSLCELINYFLLTPNIPLARKWLRFVCSTVSWVMVHVLDGLITFTFNKELRKSLRKTNHIPRIPFIRRKVNKNRMSSSRSGNNWIVLLASNHPMMLLLSRRFPMFSPSHRPSWGFNLNQNPHNNRAASHKTMMKTYEVVKLVTKLGFLFTFLTNIIVIYLTLYYTKNVVRTYKNMIVIFATACILFAAWELVARPGLHSYNGGFIYFSLNENHPQELLQYALVLYAAFYAILISFVSIQFIFRYWALITSKWLKLFRGWKMIVWVFYMLFSVPYGVLMYVCLQPDAFSDEYMKEEMLRIYSMEVKDLARFTQVAYDQKGDVRWNNMTFLFIGSLILVSEGNNSPISPFQCTTYSIIIYCSIQMRAALKNNASVFSAKRQTLERQFFKALIVQILLPTLFLSLPSFIVLVVPFLDVPVSFQSMVIFALFSLYPPLDSLAMMFIVTEYTKSVKRAIGDLRNALFSSAEASVTSSRNSAK